MFKLLRVLGPWLVYFCLCPTHSAAQTDVEHWVVTWTSAPGPYTAAFIRPPEPQFVDVRTEGVFDNQTIRMMVRTTIGGRRVRIRLSNLFGKTPLRIGTAHIALFPTNFEEPIDASIISGTDRIVLFGGIQSVTIPAGQTILSDPVDLTLPPMASVAVSLYVPGRTPAATTHYAGRLAGVVSGSGNFSAQDRIQGIRFGTHAWISSVDVFAPPDAAAIVVVSDDSAVVTYPAWPARLATRLLSDPTTEHIAVVTQADSNFRFSFIDTGQGVPAVDRLDRDVLGQSGVQWIVLAPFIPEIWFSSRPQNPLFKVSVDDLAKVFRDIVESAHRKGVKVIACTVPPSSLERGEDKRQAINSWIRTAGLFDSLIDLDGIMRDPDRPDQLRAAYGAGRPHPELADVIDLSLFTPLGHR